MRKFLSTVLFMLAVLCGKSQVILNEVYTDPNIKSKNNHEFFELYNTSVSSQPVDLDCYTLVTLFEQGGKIGFYVLDLPKLPIYSKSYFVGAAANPFNVQGQSNKPAAFSWNSLGSTDTATGSLKGYLFNGTDYTSVSIPQNFNDLFPTLSGQGAGGAKYGVFLFNKGVYVNGFLGSYGSTTVPLQITTLPSKTITLNSTCGSFILDWKTVTTAEYSGEAVGNDNGFARTNDGRCGTWNKTSSQVNHTPNETNGSSTGTTTSNLITSEGYPCGTHVLYNVTGANTPDVLPIYVHMYYDNSPLGTLDASDIYKYSDTITSFTEGQQSFSISEADKNRTVLLVYETNVGCYDKIVALSPQSSGSLITEQKNICGSRVDFRITGSTAGFVNNYARTINVYLYYDKGIIGTYEPTIDIDLVPQAAPLTNPRYVDRFSQDLYTFNIPAEAKDQPVILVYDAPYACFDKNVVPEKAFGNLTTTETNICGKTINVSISIFGSAVYAFPITAKLYYKDDPTLVKSVVIESGSPTTSFTGLDPLKTPTIVYEYTYSCFDNKFTRNNIAANLQVGGEIFPDITTDGTRKVNYFLEFLGTTAEAFPLVLEAWEDINKNGILDSASTDPTDPSGPSIDKLIERRRIGAISETDAFQKFVAYLSNPSSYLIVKATSDPTCSYNKVSIAHTYVPLPVHFQSFNAARNKEKKEQVVLKWVTATEQNNRGFNVQRKVNGQWKNIAFVFSQADNGNSNTTLAYEYKDMNVSNTVTQYQIQQVDYDGKTSYSNIKAVVGLEQKKSVVTYPNPGVDGKVNLLFSDLGSVKEVIVSDLNGRIVKQFRKVTENNITIDGLQSGFYTIKITDQSTATTTVEKVIIK